MTSREPEKKQTRDPNTLRAQYLENSWRCYLATIAIVSLLWVLIKVEPYAKSAPTEKTVNNFNGDYHAINW